MTPPFDVLVVGAGSAGCVVAARLSENPSCRVGLVEAGTMPVDPDIADPLKWTQLQGRSFDWCFRTVPQQQTANRSHDWPRGKVVGGSGCLHAMAYVRGHPLDFAPWARVGGSRWSWDGLAEGFARSSALLPDGGGPLDVWRPEAEVSPLVADYMQAGEALGVPRIAGHNRGQLIGTTPNSLNIRAGRRLTLADAYLTPEVLARPNLVLLTGCSAEKILFDKADATSVLVLSQAGQMLLSAGKIVLSLGTVGTPLLLMRSGIGDAAVLDAAGIATNRHLPGVGRNLQDHMLIAGVVYRSRQPVPPSRLQHSESLMYLDSRDLTRAHGQPDSVLGCVVAPVATAEASQAVSLPDHGAGYTILSGQTHPFSRGRISVTGPSLENPPVIDPQYLAHPEDRATMRRALKLARVVGAQGALDRWRGDEVLPGPGVRSDTELDAFIARAAMTHHHPAGTCCMGLDDASVVDPDLCLHGSSNVHVVDASVIPTLPSGPINAVTVAIAETWAALQR